MSLGLKHVILPDGSQIAFRVAKPFQEEMGISFKKGGQIPGAGSKVKQDF